MDINTGDLLEQGSSYLAALSWLWGIGPMQVISAQNMDYVSQEEVDRKIQLAIDTGLKIVENF